MTEKIEIFQYRVELRHSDPLVWRRFLVRSDWTFEDLHFCIQCLMDWDGDHAYAFDVRNLSIMNPEYMGTPFELPTYVHEVTLADQMKRTGFKFSYTYDFGDNWDHDIFFEKRLPFDENFKYPICLEGENACPPDDIGGISYFYERLDAAKNPGKYPDWDTDWLEHLAGWLRDFDLYAFNIDAINKALRWNRSLGEREGDAVFLKPFDLDDSSFEIKYRSRQKNEKKAAQIRQADTKFLSSLKTVIESAVPLRSITQQITYALQNLYPAMWPIPPNPLHELIENSKDLRLIEPGRGKKILQVI